MTCTVDAIESILKSMIIAGIAAIRGIASSRTSHRIKLSPARKAGVL